MSQDKQRIRLASGSNPHPATHKMDPWTTHEVFREMVAGQLRQGKLSQRRRKQVVQFAACLGINAVQAGRLMEQARRKVDEPPAAVPCLGYLPSTSPTRSRRRRLPILAIVIGAALLQAWALIRAIS